LVLVLSISPFEIACLFVEVVLDKLSEFDPLLHAEDVRVAPVLVSV